MIHAVDGNHRRRAGGRGGDGVEKILIQIQAAQTAVVSFHLLLRTIGMTQAQAAETVLEPGCQVVMFTQRQPGASAQLPRRRSVIRAAGGQGTPALGGFAPGLPETV
ncbi:hypothetical protein D3C79_694160 [compost metagenome]